VRSDKPRVLIVGGGLIGRNIAFQLSCREFAVHLVDPGTGHSLTTGGSLGVLTHFNGGDSALSLLYRDSHGSFAALSDELRTLTGLDIGWRQLGGLDLIFTDADEADAEEKYTLNGERGCPVERLDGADVLRLEPAVDPRVRGGLYFPGDHRVEPQALSHALGMAITQQGGKLELGATFVGVSEVRPEGLVVQIGGSRCSVDFLVLAAGAWTAEIAAGLGSRVPVRPVRGQHARGRGPRPEHILRHGGRHLLPSGDMTLVGATVEEVGFDAGTTSAAAELFAASWGRVLGGAPDWQEQRAGLRPKPKGGRPLIGPLTETPRVFVATGHYKNGVLMGPMTGMILAEWLSNGSAPRDMSYFAPER
jgi:glycine oxidase